MADPKKLTEPQLARKDLLDTIRTAVRLQSIIARRRLLNEIEPRLLKAYDEQRDSGKPYHFNLRDILEEVFALEP